MNTNPQFHPITCPNCGSREIAYVTEYHKCVLLKIINSIIVVIAIIQLFKSISSFFENTDDSTLNSFLLIILPVIYILIQIIIFFTESRTHVRAICKNCGNLWLLD